MWWRAKAGALGLGLALALAGAPARASDCVLRMGYRPEARPPLMAEAPDNSGVYLRLYERVAQRLGCKLQVQRQPKLRVLRALQAGELDFYPGMDFDLERDAFLLFMLNGLPGEVVAVSRKGTPPLTHLDDLRGRRVLAAAGQADRLQGMSPEARAQVKEVRMVSASLESALEMLLRDRADFFLYTRSSVEALLAERPELREALRLHPECCGGASVYYAGFAKASPHVRLQANPAFHPQRPLGPGNQRERSAPDTVAARFAQVLEQMHRSGETQHLAEAASEPAR